MIKVCRRRRPITCLTGGSGSSNANNKPIVRRTIGDRFAALHATLRSIDDVLSDSIVVWSVAESRAQPPHCHAGTFTKRGTRTAQQIFSWQGQIREALPTKKRGLSKILSVLKLKNIFDTNESGLDNYSLFSLRRQLIFLFCEGYINGGECW